MAIISTSSNSNSKIAKKKQPKETATLKPDQTILDKQYEPSLRPQNLNEYIGQTRLKELLRVCIGAAKKRDDITSIGHFLLYGSPGLGKTSSAIILARELGTEAKVFSAPALSQPKDIIGLFRAKNLEKCFQKPIAKTPRKFTENTEITAKTKVKLRSAAGARSKG